MPEIRTSRLTLRPARLDDLPALHEIFSDPRAMAYWSSLPHATLEETSEWLQGMIESPRNGRSDFIIEYEGRAIGKAGCWQLPEIGFILHPDFWGRGFAREALEAVLPHIFAAFAVDRIVADVDPRNRASLGLLKRLGFGETHRAQGTWTIGD